MADLYREQSLSSQPAQIAWYKKAVFIILLTLPIIIPSDWTQDVPARYSSRHPGISYSAIYPRIDQPGNEIIKDEDKQLENEDGEDDLTK